MSELAKPSSDILVAVRNLAKLGSSLGLTLVIGFVIRPLLRRWLGPDSFGPLDAADGFTAVSFIALTLGVDSYIFKEIPLRPKHANDFFASVLLTRLALCVPIFAVMQGVMIATHRPPLLQWLVWVLGLTQFMIALASTLGSLLQANTTVDGLSAVNVFSKVLWAAVALGGVALGYGIKAVALALLFSETIKAALSWSLCRKHLDLSLATFGWRPAKVIVLASLPFYLNTVFHTVYNKVDVFLLSVIAGDRLGVRAGDEETGWYGAASALGGMSMLLVPLLFGVMMPLLARAREKDPEEYNRLIKRSLELILTVAIPITLALGIGADVGIGLLFGHAYAPASLALRLLAPVYLFIYVSIISGVVLLLENYAWTLAIISACALVLNLIANLLLIGPALQWYGPSAGGVACAAIQILTEAAVATTMVVMMGRRSFDARSVKMLLKTAAVCAAVIGLDWMLRRQAPGIPGLVRMTINGCAYAAGVVLSRAVNVREMFEFGKQAFKSKAAEPVVAG